MTQAPTPGPLSAQQEEAIAFNLCSLHGFDPAFVTTQRDFAFAVIKEYERARPSLAPTAPVEASGSDWRQAASGKRLVVNLASYCGAETPGCTDTSPCCACLKQANVFERGTDPFGAYVAQFGDLPRPQPSGETRGDYDRSDVRYGLQLIADEECDEVAASYYAKKALALLSTPARAEAQDEGAAGERDTSDAIELLVKAKDALQGHVAAIQAGKQASEIGRPLGQPNPILGCINGLPEIVRWLDAAQFDIEAAFEDYEDRAHPSPTPAADADRVRIAVEALEQIVDLGSDGEHSGDRHARCRDIARAALKSTAAKEGE